MVCGGSGDEQICIGNFSAQEIDWLSYYSNEISVEKTAKLDEADPNVVWYRVDIVNNDDVNKVAVTVTDYLPESMVLLDSIVPFASYEDDTIKWNLVDIGPHETKTIAYRVEALHAGRFVNSVEVDAVSIDGRVVQPLYANFVIDVGEAEEVGGLFSTTGWRLPNWDFEYVSYPTELTCEEIFSQGL